MQTEHEYALLGGFNRAKIGRYLSLLAAAVSAAIVFVLLAFVDIANGLGLPANLPPTVLSLASAGAVYGGLYWIFDGFAWRLPALSRLLKVPNLAGEWQCEGQRFDAEGSSPAPWAGTVAITQSWDKIRIRLKTDHSGSNSLAAALMHDAVDGFQLLYHYRNDPNVNEPELRPHHGFASLTFAADCQSAKGEYFNGRGRITFGTMQLTRMN